MAEHDFQINFTVNNQQTVQAREEEKAGYKQVEQVADESIKNIARASAEAAKERKRQVTELLTAEQAAAKAKQDLIREQNAAAVAAAKQAMKATDETTASQKDWTAAIGGTLANMRGLLGVSAGLGAVGQAVSLVSQRFDEANKAAQSAAREASAFRDRLKEIASLTGQPNANAQTIAREMEIRSQTLQSVGDVTALQATAFGLAGSSVGNEPGSKMTPDEFKTALIGAGQLQAIKGIDASAMGGMLGAQVLNTPGQNLSGEAVKKQMYSLFKVADAGGMSPKQFADSFGQLAPMVKSGDIGSLTDLAGLMSTMSLSDPGTVTTRVQQLQRLTKGSINDVSKPAGAKMSPAEYLKGLGATDQMDMSTILGMMGKDVEAKSAEARKSGKTLSMDTYLRERGYGSIEDINAFKAYSANQDKSAKFTEMAGKPVTSEDIARQVRGYALSPQGFNAQTSIQEDQQKIGAGIGAGEYSEAYKRSLFAQIKARDKDANFGWKGDYSDATSGIIGRKMFKEELQQDLFRRASAAGLKDSDFGGGRMFGSDKFTDLYNARAGSTEEANLITEIITKIQAAGGSALGSKETDDILKKQLESAKATEASMRDIANRLPAQPALNANPGGVNAGRLP